MKFIKALIFRKCIRSCFSWNSTVPEERCFYIFTEFSSNKNLKTALAAQCTVWKSTKKRDHAEKFREIYSFLTSLVKALIWRKNVDFSIKIVIGFYSTFYFHTVQCEKRKNSHQIKISSNQLFSNFFSKSVTFTKFLPKNEWE